MLSTASAIAVLSAVLALLLPVAAVLATLARKALNEHVSARDAALLVAVVKGAYVIVSKIAEATPNFPLDDGIAKVLEIVAKEFELVRGKPLSTAQKERAKVIALSLHSDKQKPGGLGLERGALPEIVASILNKRSP